MDRTPTRNAGLERLAEFLPRAGRDYANTRNFDDGNTAGEPRHNVSQLSPWLHAGLLSEAEVIETVLNRHSQSASDKFVAEVFWRVYFKGYLEQRPSIWSDYRAGRDEALERLRQDAGLQDSYDKATSGKTGIEAFDHWAKELIATGYLHNHARMWFASIWIFTLRLDWQLGADFFLRHLIDGDAASNTLSWRWVGGLHTKGKTYLARPDNIARYTANRQGGSLAAKGLAQSAPPLEEKQAHDRIALNLPPVSDPTALSRPYALLLHDEAASHELLNLPQPPALVVGAARPEERSPVVTGELAVRFAGDGISTAMTSAADAYGCPCVDWSNDLALANLLQTNRIEHVVTPYLPVGWTRDALWPQLAPMENAGDLTILVSDLDRATWPDAKAGFFNVKKKIPAILDQLGLVESNSPRLPL